MRLCIFGQCYNGKCDIWEGICFYPLFVWLSQPDESGGLLNTNYPKLSQFRLNGFSLFWSIIRHYAYISDIPFSNVFNSYLAPMISTCKNNTSDSSSIFKHVIFPVKWIHYWNGISTIKGEIKNGRCCYTKE